MKPSTKLSIFGGKKSGSLHQHVSSSIGSSPNYLSLDDSPGETEKKDASLRKAGGLVGSVIGAAVTEGTVMGINGAIYATKLGGVATVAIGAGLAAAGTIGGALIGLGGTYVFINWSNSRSEAKEREMRRKQEKDMELFTKKIEEEMEKKWEEAIKKVQQQLTRDTTGTVPATHQGALPSLQPVPTSVATIGQRGIDNTTLSSSRQTTPTNLVAMPASSASIVSSEAPLVLDQENREGEDEVSSVSSMSSSSSSSQVLKLIPTPDVLLQTIIKEGVEARRSDLENENDDDTTSAYSDTDEQQPTAPSSSSASSASSVVASSLSIASTSRFRLGAPASTSSSSLSSSSSAPAVRYQRG